MIGEIALVVIALMLLAVVGALQQLVEAMNKMLKIYEDSYGEADAPADQ